MTSGSKGLHLYADLPKRLPSDESTALAKEVAEELEKAHPKLVTATMTKARRSGKVFLDWSQNSGSKTTISPYSLRGKEKPYVAAPLGWDEVEAGAEDPDATRAAPLRRGAGARGGVRRPVRLTLAGAGRATSLNGCYPTLVQSWTGRGPRPDTVPLVWRYGPLGMARPSGG